MIVTNSLFRGQLQTNLSNRIINVFANFKKHKQPASGIHEAGCLYYKNPLNKSRFYEAAKDITIYQTPSSS